MSDFSENHISFERYQRDQADASYIFLGNHANEFLRSYKILASLQAWNSYIVEGALSTDAYTFFVEAQNDAISSHLLARQGMWRPALQSLRSCLENILVCHYYAEHPVELALWKIGEHRTGFAELRNYFEGHPSFRNFKNPALLPFSQIKEEYAQLSKAVHGSSASFLMGDKDNIPNVYVADAKSLGQWLTRQLRTVKLVNQFMLIFYRDRLMGTAYPMMRSSLHDIFSGNIRDMIKAELNITL
jgi:hypothetical protein